LGDSRRFRLFAERIAANIPAAARVADVAGGKGRLQAELRKLGYADVTTYDKRRECSCGRPGYVYGWFRWDQPAGFDAVVALHPDEGTDHALLYAISNRVPAVVCPCCISPSGAAYGGNRTYPAWFAHLVRLAQRGRMRVTTAKLAMTGRNDVIIATPLPDRRPRGRQRRSR
jgi:hypothetical protein